MAKEIITEITVTRLGCKGESITIEDDHFVLSGVFGFPFDEDKDEFFDELRQTFEIICPFGCTVEVSGTRPEAIPDLPVFKES